MQLYKVTLNWSGEIHQQYTQASSEHRALNNAIRQLSKKLGFVYSYYRSKFNGQTDNFKIEKIIK
jgi:hypothetical protein